MAEEGSDSSQEKTEEPTPRRLEKAREEGQIPRSRELTTTAILLAGTLGLMVFGATMVEHFFSIMKYNFLLEREQIFDTNAMLIHLGRSFKEALFIVGPLFFMLLVASIAGPIALGGWMVSAKAMAPKFSRMNPLQGLQRMFGVKALVELAKAVAKVLVVSLIAWIMLSAMFRQLLSLGLQPLEPAITLAVELILWAAIALSAATVLIAVADVPFQIWDHTRKLKMTFQQIKDEMKDTEGKPEVKGRIRQLQRDMANNRMMAAVPEADVVITNPTHYSVALKYEPETMSTPILLAKGADIIAMKIREVAKANNIEIVQSPMLTRAIFHTTEIEQEIPSGLYLAVAQVLAYVFQLRNYRKGMGERPDYPKNLTVPPEMRYDP